MNRNAEQKVQKNGEVVSKASVANPFDNSTNRHKKRTMIAILSLSLCFLLATTFGLQAVFRNKVDQGFNQQYQIEQNESIINDIIVTSKNLIMDKTQLQKTSSTKLERQRVDELLADSESVFDKISINLDEALAQLINILNEEELQIMDTILDDLSKFEESNKQTRGQFNINLYVAFSTGYFVGYLVSGAIVSFITSIVLSVMGLGTAAGGPVGLVVGGIIGAILGGYIQSLVQNLIDRDGKAGFHITLINTSFWFLWNAKWEKNLLDYIMDLISFGGGGWIAGSFAAVPSGHIRLQYA